MEPITITFIFLLSLCWGSFLAATAYRIAFDRKLSTSRSYCPKCNKKINWHDNLPLISWLLLQGKCRNCKKTISLIYPFIELITGICITALWYKYFGQNVTQSIIQEGSFISTYWQDFATYQHTISFISYFIFFSALILATATDFFAMVIPQVVTLWLVPVGILFAYTNVITITTLESILGVILGYSILWIVATVFKQITKKDGLGVGDMEQLAMIGSFLGPEGVWYTLMLGSISGALVGSAYLIITKQESSTRIPFGPFLALGATLYYFFVML